VRKADGCGGSWVGCEKQREKLGKIPKERERAAKNWTCKIRKKDAHCQCKRQPSKQLHAFFNFRMTRRWFIRHTPYIHPFSLFPFSIFQLHPTFLPPLHAGVGFSTGLKFHRMTFIIVHDHCGPQLCGMG